MNEFDKKARKIAIWVIVIMIVIWIILSIFSFMNSEERGRPKTPDVFFEGQSALYGKQVFQSYNCMDCHTIVGNGAYFAPDLTKTYKHTGPAWLKAYLGSPATYPTRSVVNVQLKQMAEKGIVDVTDIDAYLDKYEGAKERVERRGGIDALMPNLRFSPEEIDALIAYLDYTSRVNTGGWPPEVIANKNIVEAMKLQLEAKSGLHSPQAAVGTGVIGDAGNQEALSPAELGEHIAIDLGCMACHSTDGSIQIGPSFKGIYGTDVKLTDGRTVEIDVDYLRRSILDPNAEIVDGFEAVMPPYDGIIEEEEIGNVIEFIKSLK